ncbi:MAG: methyltransferase domain-containing protein [Candidatus Aminicenantes bacterium]|nr:methyltransferase domain-containing protein [Candidatus Aminicenantes bacterium]
MKILESAPKRYDLGIRLLTGGRLDKVYDRLASHIKEGDKVLDIGCGTGALSIRAAQKGGRVKGIDINSQMLEIAQIWANKLNLTEQIELCEMGIAELDREEADSYDVMMSGLCFSELDDDELSFTLREAKRIIKPGGLLLVADEVRPEKIYKKIINGLRRIFFGAIVFIITQTTTKALKNLPEKIRDSGFDIKSIKINRGENFIELIARKP